MGEEKVDLTWGVLRRGQRSLLEAEGGEAREAGCCSPVGMEG